MACRCALCAYPAASCLVGLGFGLLWAWAMWHETQRLWHAVINMRLRRRVRTFQACSIAGTHPCPPVAVQVHIRRAWFSCPSQLGCSDLPTIVARCPCKYEKVLALP